MARYTKKKLGRGGYVIIAVISIIAVFSVIAVVINPNNKDDIKEPTGEVSTEHNKPVKVTEENENVIKEEPKKDNNSSVQAGGLIEEKPNPEKKLETSKKVKDMSKYGKSDEYFSLEELKSLKKSKYLMIANYEKSIDEYAPSSLSTLQGYKIDSDIKEPLEAFIDDVNSQNVGNLVICSAYRTYNYQKGLFERRIKRCQDEEGLSYTEAEKKAATIVARPGTSEHQTGLTIDMMDSDANKEYGLSREFAKTDMYQYMKKTAHKYGFIERYNIDKQDITKIIFEPWHYRYVGEKNASIMYEKNMCLEEYLDWIDYEIQRRS